MKSTRPLLFTLASVAAGLFAALLVLNLVNDKDPRPSPNVSKAINPAGVPPGPVSYASAVEAATPSVVNIYTTKVTLERRSRLFDDPIFQRFSVIVLPRNRKKDAKPAWDPASLSATAASFLPIIM